MRKVCAKMVPKNFTTEQKANRKDVCLDLDRLDREPKFFSRVITGNESWILEYGPETKRQSQEWHTAKSPRPKKARMSKSKIKSMLICFWQSWDCPQGICATRTRCWSNILSRSPLRDSGKGWHVCDKAFHALGCCTTTTPHVTRQSPSMNFGRKKHSCGSSAAQIRRISVPVTSFYSPGSKTTWKGAILVLWIISRTA